MSLRDLQEEIIQKMLKVRGEPPPKMQPKFKIHDIVENKDGLKGIITTTEKEETLKQADSYFTERFAERFGREYVFWVEWFASEGENGFVSQEQLTLCNGFNNLNKCDDCKYRFECWTTRHKS
jgi:hypothetical protein